MSLLALFLMGLLCPLICAAECGGAGACLEDHDETSLMQLKQALKHGSGRVPIADPRGSGAQLLQSLENTTKVQAPPYGADIHAPRNKNFIYFRHGESQGNAGNAVRAADGRLTGTGESQAVQRVGLLDPADLIRLQGSDVILVSPLRRAMGTALILVATAMRSCPGGGARGSICDDADPYGGGAVFVLVPTAVYVDTRLREKVKSVSEKPGCGWSDPLNYLDEMYEKYSDGLPDALRARLHAIKEAMKTSYRTAKSYATTGAPGAAYAHECVNWYPLPKDAAVYANMIREFKNDAVTYGPGDNLLIVAHSGLARQMFSPWFWKPNTPGQPQTYMVDLAAATAADKAMIRLMNVKIGGQDKVYGLNNCGLATGQLTDTPGAPETNLIAGLHDNEVDFTTRFSNVMIGAVNPGDVAFPNSDVTERKISLFQQIREAKAPTVFTEQIPLDGCFFYGLFAKQMEGMTGSKTDPRSNTWETRYVVISWSGGHTYLSWAKKFGEPSGHIEIVGNAALAIPTNVQDANTGKWVLSVPGIATGVGGVLAGTEYVLKFRVVDHVLEAPNAFTAAPPIGFEALVMQAAFNKIQAYSAAVASPC